MNLREYVVWPASDAVSHLIHDIYFSHIIIDTKQTTCTNRPVGGQWMFRLLFWVRLLIFDEKWKINKNKISKCEKAFWSNKRDPVGLESDTIYLYWLTVLLLHWSLHELTRHLHTCEIRLASTYCLAWDSISIKSCRKKQSAISPLPNTLVVIVYVDEKWFFCLLVNDQLEL